MITPPDTSIRVDSETVRVDTSATWRVDTDLSVSASTRVLLIQPTATRPGGLWRGRSE